MHSPGKICDPPPIKVYGKIPPNLVLHLASEFAHRNNPYGNGRCDMFLKIFSNWRYHEFALRTFNMSTSLAAISLCQIWFSDMVKRGSIALCHFFKPYWWCYNFDSINCAWCNTNLKSLFISNMSKGFYHQIGDTVSTAVVCKCYAQKKSYFINRWILFTWFRNALQLTN